MSGPDGRRPPVTKQTTHRQGSGPHVPVLTRLHALFPSSPNANSPTTDSPVNEAGPPLPPKAQPKALKVRIITWNMHDSFPKGDVEELLGKVPLWTESASKPGTIANLPLEAIHPYHFVVVAGQECPTMSGLPMGLGAGWKRTESNKDKDWEKEREKGLEKEERKKEKEREEAGKSKKNDEAQHDIPSGWSQLLDEWYCQGAGSLRRPPSPNPAEISSPKPLGSRSQAKDSKKGPYQLLVKERLMGIYLAVFIHRDLKPLVRGTSHSAVTAGLIGGRVGNKGGVGISVNLDGTTVLFLNAHLAAHEGKIQHRLANLAKIKNELSVDAFDNPKCMAEDLTDRFDYTFVFGDLNFRLDITRLHADWLISRKDYAQALGFDQLLKLMKEGRAFVGFSEATINFAPTFKYDVLRSLKHIRRKQAKLKNKQNGEPIRQLTEVEEKEIEELEKEEARAMEEMNGGEGASMVSSAWTSVQSRIDKDEDEEFYSSTSVQPISGSQSKTSIAVQAAQRAKAKWLSLVTHSSASLGHKPTISRRKRASAKNKQHGRSSMDLESARKRPASPTPTDLSRRKTTSVAMVSSNTKTSSIDDEDEDFDKGVYDSSTKQRVPSWCDRILWKSTVEPDPEPEPEPIRPRNKIGQFFAAFRPLSARPRRDSTVSIATTATTTTESFDNPQSSAPASQDISTPSPGRLNRKTSAPDLPLRRSNSATFNTTTPANSPTLVEQHQLPGRRGRGLTTTSTAPNPPPQTAVPTRKWTFTLPSFLSLHPNPSTTSTEPPLSTDPLPPRKGDVVCLSYNTLDDRGMRRLEGRSDHRPVIGSYVIYM